MKVIYNELSTLISILRKWEYAFFLIYIFSWIVRIVYKNPILLIPVSLKGVRLHVPIFHPINRMLTETFIYENLNFIKWKENVLDLGGFIWETAIYLSQNNRHIDTYEIDSKNYELLKRNCQHLWSINYFHSWVSNKNWILSVSKSIHFDPSWALWITGIAKVKVIDILDILKQKKYDAIKIDIEWEEFKVVSRILDNNYFIFEVWFIEYHFLWDNITSKKDIFLGHIDKLTWLWYDIWFIDNYGKRINVNICQYVYISLCFSKK
jgi:hypothetical protein